MDRYHLGLVRVTKYNVNNVKVNTEKFEFQVNSVGMTMVIPPPPPMSPSTLEAGRTAPPSRPGQPQNDSGFVVFLNIVNTLTHMLLGGIAICAFYYVNLVSAFANFSHFRAHVYLCVTGYVIVMTQAILAFNPYLGWAHNLKYPQKRMGHYIMQIFGSILAITGAALRISDLHGNGFNNSMSAHGVTGFIAMLLTVVSLVGGILHLIFPDWKNNSALKITHVCLGALTLSFAFLALCLGFEQIRLGMGNINTNLSISMTVFALIGTLLLTFARIIKHRCDRQ